MFTRSNEQPALTAVADESGRIVWKLSAYLQRINPEEIPACPLWVEPTEIDPTISMTDPLGKAAPAVNPENVLPSERPTTSPEESVEMPTIVA